MKYSFDSSSFIELNSNYPLDVFPTIWQRFSGMIERNAIVATIHVYDEIKQIDDNIHSFLKERRTIIFQQLDSEQESIVSDIVNHHFPEWVKPDSTANKADPFVIALAKRFDLVVVTEERRHPQRVSIPVVCDALDVKCCNLLSFMREIKLQV